MSGGDGQRFEDTMDVLEARREETETRFRDLLAQLTTHVEDVRTAAERSTRLYREHVDVRREALASVKDSLAEAAGKDPPDADVAWPSGGGAARRLLNGLSRWVLRDFFEVLDRRGDTLGARVETLRERVDWLQSTVSTDDEAAEALNEVLGAAQQALQAALATHAEMLQLVNAKDAEVLQRAVAGPLRRMEVLFDEFGRQQEALLSQLVGRRRELDRLVRAAGPSPQGEDGIQ